MIKEQHSRLNSCLLFAFLLFFLSHAFLAHAAIQWPPQGPVTHTHDSACPKGDGYSYLDSDPVQLIPPPDDSHAMFTLLRAEYPEEEGWTFISEFKDQRPNKTILHGRIHIGNYESVFHTDHNSGVKFGVESPWLYSVCYKKGLMEPPTLRWIQFVTLNSNFDDQEDKTVYCLIDGATLYGDDGEPFYWDSVNQINTYRNIRELGFKDMPGIVHLPNDYSFVDFELFLVEEIKTPGGGTTVYIHDGIKWGFKAGCQYQDFIDFEDATGDNNPVDVDYNESHGVEFVVEWKETPQGNWLEGPPKFEDRGWDPLNDNFSGFLYNQGGEDAWDTEAQSEQGDLGNYFLRGSATVTVTKDVKLHIYFDQDVADFSGQIWDIDSYWEGDPSMEEQWEVTAFDDYEVQIDSFPSPVGRSIQPDSLDGRKWVIEDPNSGGPLTDPLSAIRHVVIDFIGTRNDEIGFALNDLSFTWREQLPPPPPAPLSVLDITEPTESGSDRLNYEEAP